ncbi:hypothetical protein Acr_25g0003180 [Actinidia rufa]|uniref:Uncharacterized protein n=1 Tax=Actinidia rufa TaxID=165716 RepID=A0A7J0GYK8_9ERIC|nr:hypothetical protein Acr_25g0003180 [Actinidia rufa]
MGDYFPPKSRVHGSGMEECRSFKGEMFWMACLSWFNKAIVTVVEELEIQEGKEMAMGGYPMAILWSIWNMRNKCVPELNSRLGKFLAFD